MAETITSAANPLVKRIRQLSQRKYRRQEGAFVIEGAQPVWRAVEAGWEIEALVIAPDLLTGSALMEMVSGQEAKGVRVARLSRELFLRLASRDGPSGVCAIARGRAAELQGLTVQPDSVFVALHRIGNPGNLGTIIRTADAAGGSAVLLIGETADPFDPTAVKASMGSLFGISVAHADSPESFVEWADRNGVRLFATSGHAETIYWDSKYARPLAILLGSEGTGLPEDLLERADQRIRIPMEGTAESLNVAVAAALMLYEIRRQSRHP